MDCWCCGQLKVGTWKVLWPAMRYQILQPSDRMPSSSADEFDDLGQDEEEEEEAEDADGGEGEEAVLDAARQG